MKTFDHNGYTVKITIHHDEHMGAPWKEHDGHGIVSEWVSRDKKPGERVLNSDRGSKRYYDFAETMKIAKRDGWGLSEESKAVLSKKLGRTLTAGDILAAAVENDFEYIRGWCNDEWHWIGYTTEIETPDGQTLDGHSCWGFEGTDDGEKYMIREAQSNAAFTIESHLALCEQTQLAECYP